MKAIQYTRFGDSSALTIADIPKPSIKPDEVLVKTAAITVNPFEIKVRDGKMKEMVPIQFPYVPGSDVAGVVVETGSGIKTIKKGDKVFGTRFGGTYAEFVAIPEGQITVIPEGLSFNDAAALAVPLVTAYTVLVETAALKTGQRILIQGASGAVGAVMVQMAKSIGAYVIGTATGNGIDFVKSLGADEVIDYKSSTFINDVKDIDIVADLAGGPSQDKLFDTLRSGGHLISIFMPPSQELAKKFNVKAEFVNSTPSTKKLNYGTELVSKGAVKAHVAKVMRLDDAAAAQDLVTKGGINGKVVLKVG